MQAELDLCMKHACLVRNFVPWICGGGGELDQRLVAEIGNRND